ncbi:MAG: type II toxin-antitoxin system RelE/ParE family toxin [Flavobacterium sp.]|nr:type II toxin-antitoxin system RelE/ParE family toxin [Flavobacterium sp.]
MERIVKPVFWTNRAVKDLEKITRFNSKLYGFKKAIEIALGIKKETEIFENKKYDFSEIGSIDETFSHLKRDYRKLIVHHCKITYREGKDKIFINRVFDTRQNPSKNK